MNYDQDRIRQYFNTYADQEFERLVSSPKNRMSLAIHQYYLAKYISEGDKVLELGAGAGRFSIFLANLGADLVVSDLSPVQLELNRNRMDELGMSVSDFLLLDITDLNQLAADQFDTTVAIGGSLSYVFDQKDKAMQEMIRVTRPGGIIILGIMSRYGSLQRTLRSFAPDLIDQNFTVERVLETGDDPGYLAFENHHSHLFTHAEITEFLNDYPVEILDVTATSYLTMHRVDKLHDVVEDEAAWQKLVELELKLCKEMVDGGSHMLIVCRNLS